MAATKRIYVVKQTVGETVTESLVRAATSAQAIKHVSKPMFSADVASQDDVLRLAKTHDVQDASDAHDFYEAAQAIGIVPDLPDDDAR